MSLVIQEHARARLVTDGPDPRLVPVELRHDPEDPGTVRVRLPGGVDRTFALDLLERGLRSPATRGDIDIWPCGRAQLVLELHSADGVAVFQFDKAPFIRFLSRIRAGTAKRPAAVEATKAPATRV
ncbi:SsgA family sporulation/cell division regulator [Streptomyces sp. JH34]|uniref:SsgA family sporulation/cell division regulator n=1 Tax=unclassified Streptomyces TaxID=2593676 RepID=UPI0023F8809E|nr:SsgA family sporulation/cell division regulator [Streptomyces sp. JH34]MDF6020507.1 SsgA family sporulation/cell division regulator [Streptomyces sp. JH34]